MGRTSKNCGNRQCWRWHNRLLLVAAFASAMLTGCSSSDGPNLSDYLEELEINTQLEALHEVPVGNFRISAATLAHEDDKESSSRTWVHTKCQVFAVVEPRDEKGLLNAYNRHRGMFDDMLIVILRSASIDELSDPRWATLKSKISDAARSILGKERVRDVVFKDYGWEPI